MSLLEGGKREEEADAGCEHRWSQTLSFLLVGFLVFNSFRSLLMTLGRLFHRYGTFLNSGQVVALLLTEVGRDRRFLLKTRRNWICPSLFLSPSLHTSRRID